MILVLLVLLLEVIYELVLFGDNWDPCYNYVSSKVRFLKWELFLDF